MILPSINDFKQFAMIFVPKNMDLCCGFGIKKRFNCAPQEPEPRTRIDDKHPVQSLQDKPVSNNLSAYKKTYLLAFDTINFDDLNQTIYIFIPQGNFHCQSCKAFEEALLQIC